ncbi:MAG: hypothetical protein QG567_43 [Campylobacterota bacterium]|nr:hypothetical protein [Campylobacterota bacterium]
MKNSDISYFYSSVEVEEVFKEDSTIKTKQIPLYLYNSFKDISYKADERKDIMFIGGFAHEPNVDAVEWFTRDIWPHIQAKLPNICFYIIGSKPTDEILKLANEHIVVTGFVDDQKLEDYYSKCKLVVAPLRFGAGVKGKIIDSLYRGVPVVTTTIGAEGIQDADKIMKVSNSNSFANDVAELYENNLQLEEYSQKGLQNCKKYFSYEYAKNQLSEFMFEVNGIKE